MGAYDDDNDDYAIYGTPLESLDADNVHSQKAPRLEDQIVTDEKGRRRFHGAFTGGFSAGYFNSAGSKDGWTPSTFVSSRSKRAEQKNLPSFNPQDFMDDEDLRDQGIDPNGIRATSAFDSTSSTNKRKREPETHGPIPGKPVLEGLLLPCKDTIGIQLLRKLGWRPGQGVGPRISKMEKRLTKKEQKRYYSSHRSRSDGSGSETSESDSEFSKYDFAPDDVQPVILPVPKCDTFGLGYRPLERSNVLGFLSLPEESHLNIKDKSKKVSIRGHAFGVGAFEEDDADIYERDDMSNYDFSIGGAEEVTYNRSKKSFVSSIDYSVDQLTKVIEGFVISSKPYQKPKIYPLPVIPSDFKPIHRSRRRRFESKDSDTRGLGRHVLSAEDRQRILTEPSKATIELRTGVKKEIPQLIEPEISSVVLEPSVESIVPEQSNSFAMNRTDFKPFSTNPEKQKRYETYLSFRERGMKDTYHCVQPKTMTEWERNSERAEFERAASLYAPLTSAMAARFTTASFQECLPELKDGLNDVSQHKLSSKPTFLNLLKGDEETDERMKAAKAKMFGTLTYSKVAWHPINVLCKRFNVPNPYPDSTIVGLTTAKKEKISIFNFLSAPLNQTAGLQPIKQVPQNLATKNMPKAVDNSKNDTTEGKVSDNISTEELEEENYGLKVPTTGPPTMDLFKAIFDDTDSEDSDEEGGDKLIKETPISSSNNSTRKAQQEQNNYYQSIKQLHQDDKYDKSAEKEANSGITQLPKIPFVQPKKTVIEAKGVFKNIDFEALNEYRNIDVSVIESQPKPIETLTIGDSDKSDKSGSENEEQYGPSLPPALSKSSEVTSYSSRLMNTLISGSQLLATKSSAKSILDLISGTKEKLKKSKDWIEKSPPSKKRSKSKHKPKKNKKKKHKKEKKRKKLRKHKKHSSSSNSDSSSSDS